MSVLDVSTVPWWAWGLIYAAAGAVNAVWFLRELPRNETMQNRLAPLVESLSPLFGWQFMRGLMVTSAITVWPIWLLFALISDVPGYGKNIDEPKDGETR